MILTMKTDKDAGEKEWYQSEKSIYSYLLRVGGWLRTDPMAFCYQTKLNILGKFLEETSRCLRELEQGHIPEMDEEIEHKDWYPWLLQFINEKNDGN